MTKPLILFDTDMESDCDDAGALALLLNACRTGEAQLLGVIADAPGACVAPCCEAFLRHYGVQAPIGAVRAAEYAQSPRFAAYRAHCAAMPPHMFYNRTLAAQVGKTDADYEDAARAYRRMLVSAGDGSVTLVCVGFLTALAALLPDFRLAKEHSLTEGMAAFVPIYHLLDKLPMIRNISNKIIVLERF